MSKIKKKIIFWGIVILLVIVCGGTYMITMKHNLTLKQFDGEILNFPYNGSMDDACEWLSSNGYKFKEKKDHSGQRCLKGTLPYNSSWSYEVYYIYGNYNRGLYISFECKNPLNRDKLMEKLKEELAPFFGIGCFEQTCTWEDVFFRGRGETPSFILGSYSYAKG